MKQLVLIRHAKSDWSQPGLSDFDRPLNRRGEENAPVMGDWLAEQGVEPQALVSSPALRAAQTARQFADALDIPAEEIHFIEDIYEAGTLTLLHAVQQFDDAWEQVLMFGHNPGFTNLANRLGDGAISNVPTCGIVFLELQIDSWTDATFGCGEVEYFVTPKSIK